MITAYLILSMMTGDDEHVEDDEDEEGESGGRNVCICNWSLNS